jgi:hypothetical protein
MTELTVVHHAVNKGGKLKVNTLKGLLKASYNPVDEVDGFVRDKDISSKTSQVYYHPETKQTVVAHRGTSGFTDWFNNFAYAIGGPSLYKVTPRFKEAQKVQHDAEKKYGVEMLSTIGHSQGGLQSELLGKKGKEIITLNKATRPFTNTINDNQIDIKTKNDIVSNLNPFQSKNKNEIIIPSRSKSLLTEHKIDTLGRLKTNEVGKGVKGKIKLGLGVDNEVVNYILTQTLN